MKFSGLQKLTLLDYPEKMACTVFTAGCNFRCPFCHNATLVNDINNEVVFEENEILDFLNKRQGILEGVCITGGEPLLHDDLTEFIKKVKESGFKVKLDTNGSFPNKLKYLVNNNLIDYVAMDIKNSKEKYSKTIDVKNFDISSIEESINFLLQNKIEYEFRTTVVKEFHNLEDIENISLWIKGANKYFLQNFVDSGNLICDGLSAHEPETINKMRQIAQNNIQYVGVRGI
ncbi:MAG: anaerobic ribonucleoside-triphosphate reductase activating protein [Acutalibacteraceae bacterium]|nr:anaerobic ribonucleoside-triphosphate reductase activating protein [Acutalibacteraceae bacterium]